MARRNSADVAFMLVGGYSILGAITEISDTIEAALERVDVLGDSWQAQQYAGVRTAEIVQDGFYDDDAGAVHDALGTATNVGQSRVLCYGFGGTATGAFFTGWEGANEVRYERILARGGLTKARASYMTNGTVDVGKTVRTYKVHSATGATTGTPLDNGVSSTGGAAYLQYNATAGEANIRLLHSSDNVTYATLLTFTKTASGFGAERLVTTAVIERYTAMDVTTASATGAITALNSFMGLARGALTS